MSEIRHILVCCDHFPMKDDPVFQFVEQLVLAFAKMKIHVSVVAPQSITKHFLRKVPLHPLYRKIKNNDCGDVDVFQPYTITLGNHFGWFNRVCNAVVLWWTLKKINSKPDVCYGHFWHCARAIYPFAKKIDIPLFVSSGEANIENETVISTIDSDFLRYYKGVFFVSTKNKNESEKLGFWTNQKNIVIPNAIDTSKFYLKNKEKLRGKYHFSQDSFILAFVGAFIDRKGPQRVAEALRKLNDKNIKAFFIGCEKDGIACSFDYEGILYKGVVQHEKLVDYLNMADVFVLPTLAEGCCNAIIEAMACGLPIISSNLPFNDDILDDSCSIRVNPKSADEIANAVHLLHKNADLRKRMSMAALNKVAPLSIENRAKKIIDFMNDCLGEYRHVDMA